MSISVNPFVQIGGNAGLFNATSQGYRQGTAMPDPSTRFREDPIRILRAIKFAARLDLEITPDVYDAMVGTRDDLAKAARPSNK